MRVAVKDANIIIDLHKLHLLTKTLQLDIQFHITRFVFNELNLEQKNAIEECVKNKLIFLQDFSFEETIDIARINQEHKAFSYPDSSVLYFAKKHKTMILTGERKLRHVATQYKIEVHGIIWIFDELIQVGLLSLQKAISKMELLLNINRRLPKKLCQNRIIEWKKKL